jgi:glycosyltransferase involved in cell wall biosynthesis
MTTEIFRDPVLYIDCTSTVRSGLNTGVQRVVRALIAQAAEFAEVLHIDCIPVCNQFNQFYLLKDAETITVDSQERYTPVDFRHRDIYFCPDAFWTMNMYSWYPFLRDRGVLVATLIYDLIPLTNPELCTPEDVQIFEKALLLVVEHSDLLLCISRQTRQSLMGYCGTHDVPLNAALCPVIPLAPALKRHVSVISVAPDRLPKYDFFLMVGTVEPRRGYAEALREFSAYWTQGGKGGLLVIGKLGAAAAEIVAELEALAASGAPVSWLKDADDLTLAAAYRRAIAVVCASRVEGYGMSVSEGLAYNGLVLANRLPVFGEFAGALPYYFDIEIAGDLTRLLAQVRQLRRVDGSVELGSWSETARSIASHLAQVSAIYGEHAAIELTKNSEEAVRWAHWLIYGRLCSPEDIGLWMRYSNVAAMHAAMKHEVRNSSAPLSEDFVRWAQLILNGRDAVSPDEVDAWRSLCETGDALCEHLRHEARRLDMPITKEFVVWAQLILNGRDAVSPDEVDAWRSSCETGDALCEHLRHEARRLDMPITKEFVVWAQLILFGRQGLPDDEILYWITVCPQRTDYLRVLWHQKNAPNAPLTSDLVRSAYAFILGRESCTDEEAVFWLGRCKTLKELREHLLHEVVQASVKK